MLDDIGYWAILAAMIAFIACGCVLTRHNGKASDAQGDDGLESLPPNSA
jgi:hypothetical protein